MPRYFKNIEPLNDKKKKDLKKMWEEVAADNQKQNLADSQELLKESQKQKNENQEIKKDTSPRVPFIWTIIGLIIVVGGFLIVWYLILSKSSVTIRVKDQSSNQPLADVLVTIANTQGRTNANGEVEFKNLQSGEVSVKVTYSGYKGADQLLILKRGENGISDISIHVDKVAVSGVILDYIDKKPVTDVQVQVNESTASSDASGLFTLANLTSGSQTAAIKKTGYYDTGFTFITTQDPNQNVGEIKIVPQGRGVFASNRDGDRAVYTTRFDGSHIEKLWDNVAGYDDSSPILSPSGNRVVFFSNRDNERDSYGNLKQKLYYYDVASKKVVKISDDSGITNISWDHDGSHLLYLNSDTQATPNSSAIKNFDFSGNQPKVLMKNSDFEAKDTNGSATLSLVTVSPAENVLVFTVYNTTTPAKQGIYLLKTDGSDLKRLTEKTPVNELKFSSDGLTLTYDAYVLNSIRRYSIDLKNGKETSVPFEERRRGYFSQAGYETREAYNSNRSKKAFIDYRDGKNDLYLSNADGGDEKRLTYMGNVYKAAFVNDRYVIFGVNSPNETALYVLGLESGNAPIKITDIYPAGFAGIFQN